MWEGSVHRRRCRLALDLCRETASDQSLANGQFVEVGKVLPEWRLGWNQRNRMEKRDSRFERKRQLCPGPTSRGGGRRRKNLTLAGFESGFDESLRHHGAG